MRKSLIFVVALVVLCASVPATAGFLDVDVDGQGGYSSFSAIAPSGGDLQTLAGPAVGVHGKLKILFISAVADFQHLFIDGGNAEMLHVGLGTDFGLPLGLVEPYIRGSAGLAALYATGKAFNPDATANLEFTLGFMARVGAGLDIPLGDWFAVGVVADAGVHYFTEEAGFNYSVMGYLGLRI